MDHRYNSAPFCGKCSGPCQMVENNPRNQPDVQLELLLIEEERINAEQVVDEKQRNHNITAIELGMAQNDLAAITQRHAVLLAAYQQFPEFFTQL